MPLNRWNNGNVMYVNDAYERQMLSNDGEWCSIAAIDVLLGVNEDQSQ